MSSQFTQKNTAFLTLWQRIKEWQKATSSSQKMCVCVLEYDTYSNCCQEGVGTI